jgi:hypothetical protein
MFKMFISKGQCHECLTQFFSSKELVIPWLLIQVHQIYHCINFEIIRDTADIFVKIGSLFVA